MTSRQRRRILYAAAAGCILLALFQWGFIPAQNYRADLQTRQELVIQRIQELKALGRELEQARESATAKEPGGNKPAGFTLFTFLEEQASADKIKNSVEFMRPLDEQRNGRAQEKVQMRLDSVPLNRLTPFLTHVEQAPEGIFIERITIRSPRQTPGRLQVDVVFTTYV
ncbi:MAG: type II secretion system protein GspM [Desulfovermiculus sp.]